MITVVFFHNNNFNLITKFIEIGEDSPICHCAIGLSINGIPYLLQAETSGVQLVPRSSMVGYSVISEFQILPNIIDEITIAESKVGEQYDDLTVLGLALVLLAQKFHIGLNNPFYSKSAVICSEFIIEADINHLIHEFDGLDPADIDPSSLELICLSGSSFKAIQ